MKSARINFVAAATLLSVFGMTASVMGEMLPISTNISANLINSANWAGYAVTPTSPVNDIQASWIVPAINSPSAPDGWSASWIGIDGFGSNTVEQIGTMSLATNSATGSGLPQYFAWFECTRRGRHTGLVLSSLLATTWKRR